MSFDARLKTPGNIIVVGPTQVLKHHLISLLRFYKYYLYTSYCFQSGKSTLIRKMILSKNLLFHPIPQKVCYIYAARSPFIESMLQEGTIHRAVKGLPSDMDTLENILKPNQKVGTLLVIDDGLSQLNGYLPTVFEELTHRTNTTLVFVSQATFLNSSTYRRLSGIFIFFH